MTSKESLLNKGHWQLLATGFSKGQPTPEAMEWFDLDWTSLTAEPEGVDYAEVDANGVPAMWITPWIAAQERVIFYCHGGGFVAGSIFTRRKLVAHLAKAIGCRALLFDYPYGREQKFPARLEWREGTGQRGCEANGRGLLQGSAGRLALFLRI